MSEENRDQHDEHDSRDAIHKHDARDARDVHDARDESLRELFRPFGPKVWLEVAGELTGTAVPESSGGYVVQRRIDDWIVTAEIVRHGIETKDVSTRVRAPFVNPDGVHFSIKTEGLLHTAGRLMGLLHDIRVGDEWFDSAFIVQADHEQTVRDLLDERRIRRLLYRLPRVWLTVRDDDGWFGADFPDGVDELYLEIPGVLQDTAHLKTVFDLFEAVLERLTEMGSAYKTDIGYVIGRLKAPGGRIHDGRVLWDGDRARHRAAAELARFRNRRAIDALTDVLSDPDAALRAIAIRSLSEIRKPRAIRGLLGRLGDTTLHEGVEIRQRAADALDHLGAGDRVDAFGKALKGESDALASIPEAERPSIARAFIDLLFLGSAADVAPAVHALAWLGATEAIPSLRELRTHLSPDDVLWPALNEVVATLEGTAGLPRPSDPTGMDLDLPRPVDPSSADLDLPRPVPPFRDSVEDAAPTFEE